MCVRCGAIRSIVRDAPELEELALAGRVELQQRRSELEALRPLGPAARAIAPLDGEDRRAVGGIPASARSRESCRPTARTGARCLAAGRGESVGGRSESWPDGTITYASAGSRSSRTRPHIRRINLLYFNVKACYHLCGPTVMRCLTRMLCSFAVRRGQARRRSGAGLRGPRERRRWGVRRGEAPRQIG